MLRLSSAGVRVEKRDAAVEENQSKLAAFALLKGTFPETFFASAPTPVAYVFGTVGINNLPGDL